MPGTPISRSAALVWGADRDREDSGDRDWGRCADKAFGGRHAGFDVSRLNSFNDGRLGLGAGYLVGGEHGASLPDRINRRVDVVKPPSESWSRDKRLMNRVSVPDDPARRRIGVRAKHRVAARVPEIGTEPIPVTARKRSAEGISFLGEYHGIGPITRGSKNEEHLAGSAATGVGPRIDERIFYV